MQVLVARIGRPHGLKGEVTVQVHTDRPDQRFTVGAGFVTEPASAGPLTLRSVRVHRGIWLLGFDEAPDRTAAEALRGTRLFVARDDTGPSGPDDRDADEVDGEDVDGQYDDGEYEDIDDVEDGWYEDELLGLEVVTTSGEKVGEVAGLMNRPVQDLLVVRLTSGEEALVPFVEAIVPEVDPEQGRVVIDPPPGLLDLAGE